MTNCDWQYYEVLCRSEQKVAMEALKCPYKDMFDRSHYKWNLNANVISHEPGLKRCNRPFLIHATVVFKRMTNPLSYCLCNSPKLPLRAGTFHLPASSGLCYSSHFYFLHKCHHFINLARNQIREAAHQSCLPTERTEPSLQHTAAIRNTGRYTVHIPGNTHASFILYSTPVLCMKMTTSL